MIVGIGIDTIEVDRIARVIASYGEQFLQRIYSETERRYSEGRPHAAEHFAARFAAKEAYAKAIGTGVRHGFHWNEVAVHRERSGRPFLELSTRMMSLAEQISGGAIQIHLSLTHTAALAEAIVTIERR